MGKKQRSSKPGTVKFKASLVSFSVVLILIALSLIFGNLAFNTSLAEFESQYHNFYLRESKILAEIARLSPSSDDESLLITLRQIWEESGSRAADEYMCIVDGNAHLIEHTAHPDTVGNYAGRNAITSDSAHPEQNLADLVESQRDYVGNYTSSSGQSQLAAFSAVPGKNWTVGIHRSKEALIHDIQEGIKFSKNGFFLVCGLLMPVSWFLIYLTFHYAETKRRKTEAALLMAERKWQQVLVNTPQLGVSLNTNGTIGFVNEHFQRLTGWEEKEVIGQDWFDLFIPEDNRQEIRGVFNTVLAKQDFENFSTFQNTIVTRSGALLLVAWSNVVTKDLAGQVIDVTCLGIDVTERQRMEEALEKRILALTMPLDVNEDITFDEIFDLKEIQVLQQQFAEATGVASIITSPDGFPITQPSRFCRLCNGIIHKTDKGLTNCHQSDATLGKQSKDGPTIQRCLSGGLWDAGARISVGGRHVATWLVGQVRDERQTDEAMRFYAGEIGADEESFIEAFHEVPAMSREQFEAVAQALYTFANQLSSMAYQNLQQGRFISEKQRVEAELRESKAFLDNMTDIAYMTDDQMNVLWVNPAAQKMLGISSSDIIGKPFWPLFVEEEHAAIKDIYNRTLAGEVLESTLTMKTGATFHFSSSPKRNHHGDITGTFGIARDISLRIAAEQALSESEMRFKALHNASFGGIAIHDKGLILECNKGLTDITGFGYDELIGKNGLELISDGTRNKVIEQIASAYEKPYEVKGVRKNGELYPLRLEARNIPYKGEAVRVVEFRDLTEQKLVEEEAEELERKFTQAQKMEAVGRLAGGVAHDFNNMLSVIIGNTELAIEELDPANPLYEQLEEIKKASTRSTVLIRQLLAFARKQTISPEVLDFNETIDGMTSMLQHLIGENIDLSWMPGKDVWPVSMDPSQLDQILANLLVNARDAIPDVGHVRVETVNKELDAAYCANHSGAIPGEYVCLTISDSGCGMDAWTLENIFEPFFTTKETGKGTGLGLSTVYGVVQQNNGFLIVRSEPGKGTSFEIYFPRYGTESELFQDRVTAPPIEKGQEMVLLVEDEVSILKLTEKILERMGYQVMPAQTPGAAIKMAREYNGEIHLLVTDVIMPEMNGRDLAENIQLLYPGIKSLFMSGYTSDVIGRHGVLDESINFIQKPFSMGAFSSKIREVLND